MITIIRIYESKEIDFSHNGITILNEAISCFVTEELNGAYELELTYPLDSKGKWKHLIEDNVIKADNQLFRIYRKKKDLKSITINARHITYDLLDNFIESLSITSQDGTAAITQLLSNTSYSHSFNGYSNISALANAIVIRKNPIEVLFGEKGILANWKGELLRDNFNIGLLGRLGADKGVLITYGKNLIGIEEELNLDNVITRIYLVGKDGLTLTEKYLDSPLINAYSKPKIKDVEFSEAETQEQLRTLASNYLTTGIDIPSVNYKVNFIELSKTIQYKDYKSLETVELGDTVTVRHSKLNIDIKARVIKIKKNVITNRYDVIELGNFLDNAYKSINNISTSVSKVTQNLTNTSSYVDLLAADVERDYIKKAQLINVSSTVSISSGASGTSVNFTINIPNYSVLKIQSTTGVYCSTRNKSLYVVPSSETYENGYLKTIQVTVRYLDSVASTLSEKINVMVASY